MGWWCKNRLCQYHIFIRQTKNDSLIEQNNTSISSKNDSNGLFKSIKPHTISSLKKKHRLLSELSINQSVRMHSKLQANDARRTILESQLKRKSASNNIIESPSSSASSPQGSRKKMLNQLLQHRTSEPTQPHSLPSHTNQKTSHLSSSSVDIQKVMTTILQLLTGKSTVGKDSMISGLN